MVYQLHVERGFERLLQITAYNKSYLICGATYKRIQNPAMFFVCRALMCRHMHSLPWRAMYAHWREAHPHTSIWDPDEPDYRSVSFHFRYRNEGESLARQVISRLRTRDSDRDEFNVEDLDKLVKSGRLYCACGDPSLPLPNDLTWVELVGAPRFRSLQC